jgi:hypothetical protein
MVDGRAAGGQDRGVVDLADQLHVVWMCNGV